MASESFMLVSLKGEKAKKLAQVMANPTCTKLLDHLAQKGHDTETGVAKALNLPLSTVRYNLKQLADSKLVVADEYHYSEKGREVLHYKLAKKYIIIAPEEENPGFLEKLKQYLPITLLTLGVAAILKVLNLLTGTLAPTPVVPIAESGPAVSPFIAAVANEGASEAENRVADQAAKSVPVMGEGGMLGEAVSVSNATLPAANPPAGDLAATDLAQLVGNTTDETADQVVNVNEIISRPGWHALLTDSTIIAFLVGALFVIALFLIFEYVRYKRR